MTVEGAWSVFLVGCLGGSLSEVLHWWNLRTSNKLPRYSDKPRYWILTILMIFAGGVVAWFQFGEAAQALAAAQAGIVAPLLIQKLGTSVPEPAGARGTESSIRDFFRW